MNMDVLKKTSVEPIAFLYMMAILSEFTVVQDLVFDKFCLDFFNRNSSEGHITECPVDKNNQTSEGIQIQSQYIDRIIAYNAILAITSIFSSFIAGSYGDAIGRSIPLSVPPLLSIVAQILLIISSVYMESDFAIPLILFCAFVSGLSGGIPSFLANCFSFISNISHSNRRTLRLVVVEANVFCGGFVGYLLTGYVIKRFFKYKYDISFSIFLIIHLIILIYIWLRLRPIESVRSQTNLESNRKNVFLMFTDVIKTVFRRRESNNRKMISLLVVVFICVTLGTEVLTSLLFTFVKNPPLDWDTTMYAYYNGFKFGLSGLALCSLPLYQYFRPNLCDTSIAIVGIISRTLGLMLIGLATNSYLMFSSIALMIFSEYPLPAIRSLLSKLVSIDERGRVFAFLTLFHNLCSLSGGILYPFVYKQEINAKGFSGLGFEVTAVFQIIAIIILIYIRFELRFANFVQSSDSSDETDILEDESHDNQ